MYPWSLPRWARLSHWEKQVFRTLARIDQKRYSMEYEAWKSGTRIEIQADDLEPLPFRYGAECPNASLAIAVNRAIHSLQDFPAMSKRHLQMDNPDSLQKLHQKPPPKTTCMAPPMKATKTWNVEENQNPHFSLPCF